MKQLKFMLAAATAVGLAAAAQADGVKETKLIDNENFDAIAVDTAATAIDGYSYAGATAADNESVVKAGGYDSSANALQVNTGTDPLLRALDVSGTTARPITLTAEKSVYIDTMVQFTVTPEGDTVTKGEDDKLMIYLKEVPAVTDGEGNVTTPASTKLMVKALKYRASYMDPDLGYEVEGTADPVDVTVTYEDGSVPTTTAGTWYNLRVDTVLVAGVPMFTIKIDDALIKPAETLHLAESGSAYFPSLKGADSTTLTYVGFAGEGLVDNLTVATLEPQTSVDFTFTWTTAGISAVTYTIGDKSGTVTSGTAIADLDPGETITIAVTPADWYELVENPVLSYEVPATTGQTQPLDDLVKKVTQKTDTQGNVVLNPDATVEEVQAAASINDGYFSGSTVSKDELTAVLNWKSKKGGSDYDVNNITFAAAGDPETADAMAYLLDCSKADLDDEIDAFVFTGFDAATGTFTVGAKKNVANGAKYGNGKVEVRGATALDAADAFKAAKKEGDKFFKAFLVK